MLRIEPYRPRLIRYQKIWRIDDLKLKAYTISADPESSPSEQMLDNALQFAQSELPVVREEEGNDHGLGYAILHPGTMANWLLLHWWAHQDIALSVLATATSEAHPFANMAHRRFHACVWEQVVISHERDAWVRTLMAVGGGASHYLEDTLVDGMY